MRRDEVALLAAAHRAARLPAAWGLVPFPAGVAGAAALFALAGARGWPPALAPAYLAFGALVCLALVAALWRWERRRLAPYTFACAECGAPVLGATFGRDDLRRAELVVATGRCPRCGAQVAAGAA